LLIAGLLTVRYGMWVAAENSSHHTASERFDMVIRSDVAQLQNRFETYADTLYSGRALLVTDDSVSRQDWTTFVEAQNIRTRLPSVNGVGYVSAIDRSQSAELTAKLNADRLPGEDNPVVIRPVSSDDRLAVLTYLAPKTANQRTIGYDLMTDSTRRQVLETARDSGRPTASAPLELLSDPKNSPPSVLVAMPIYGSEAVSTVSERRAALKGYVVLSVHSRPLLDYVFKNDSAYGAVALSVSADRRVIYRAGKPAGAKALHKDVSVDVAGQSWRLSFSAPGDFGLSRTDRIAPTILLGSIASFALILSATFYFAINFKELKHRQRTYDQARLEDKDD
jgi:two-component system, sensor histidine kinase